MLNCSPEGILNIFLDPYTTLESTNSSAPISRAAVLFLALVEMATTFKKIVYVFFMKNSFLTTILD